MIITISISDEEVLDGVNRWFKKCGRDERISDIDMVSENDILNAISEFNISGNDLDLG